MSDEISAPTESEPPTHGEMIQELHNGWKAGFEDSPHMTAQLKRDEYFLDATDGMILEMCKLDADNPMTLIDRVVNGTLTYLPTLNHAFKVLMDNYQTACDEMCRAVRRGRIV